MLSLNPIFSSHMVFQANKPVRIFGTGTGRVSVSLCGSECSTVAEGEWLVELKPHGYGGPYTVSIKLDEQTVTLEDVWFGDVYLLAGQSNMGLKLHETDEPEQNYVASENVRLFVPFKRGGEAASFEDGWITLTKENARSFSAIGYYVATAQATPERKIGLVACYLGATTIQTWLPKEIANEERFFVKQKHRDHTNYPHNEYGLQYTEKFGKILPFSFNCVLWYQGESNASDEEGKIYFEMLKELIKVWREALRDAELEFIIVQIADCMPRMCEGWKLIQQAQLDAEKEIAGVKTVVCRDICENDIIHPTKKSELSKRIVNILNSSKV